jgi:hypothetical protein
MRSEYLLAVAVVVVAVFAFLRRGNGYVPAVNGTRAVDVTVSLQDSGFHRLTACGSLPPHGLSYTTPDVFPARSWRRPAGIKCAGSPSC